MLASLSSSTKEIKYQHENGNILDLTTTSKKIDLTTTHRSVCVVIQQNKHYVVPFEKTTQEMGAIGAPAFVYIYETQVI